MVVVIMTRCSKYISKLHVYITHTHTHIYTYTHIYFTRHVYGRFERAHEFAGGFVCTSGLVKFQRIRIYKNEFGKKYQYSKNEFGNKH